MDARRHRTVCHFAFAFSVRDLWDQVLQQNPSLEAPSLEWIRTQFWPRNPFYSNASKHTARLRIKFMVQSRQLQCGPSWCSLLSSYLQIYETICYYVSRLHYYGQCWYDKKIGESNFPVASVDRGTVLVGPGINFVAGDHDFTKAKVTPSVALICAKTLVNLFSGGTYLSLKRTQSFSLLVQAIMQLNWKRSW